MELTLTTIIKRCYVCIFSYIRNRLKRFQTIIIKQSICELCRCKCTNYPMICDICFLDLVRFDHQKVAGNLLNWPAINKNISHKHYQRLLVLAPYQWPYDGWIKQLKFRQNFEYASLLSLILKPLIIEQLIVNKRLDIVFTIVPIHIKKWQQRGFNQCHLIAAKAVKGEAIQYLPNLITKLNDSSSQVGQTGKQRRKSLASSFVIDHTYDLQGKHLVIFDDVLTTGTTVDSIAKRLKSVGVKEITVVTLALSLPTNV